MASIENCKILHLSTIKDYRGNLTFIENETFLPFTIQRVFYLYDVPTSESRGGHAHKELKQLIIPLSGSFEIHLDDGYNKQTFFLNKPYEGLYICPMIWGEMKEFSSGTVCLVLASMLYDENDYYRDYNKFITDIK